MLVQLSDRDKGDIARIANISEFSFLLNKKLTLYA